MLFGSLTIWTALLALLASIGCYLAAGAARDGLRRARLTRWGRGAFTLAALSVVAAAATLGTLLVTHRFDVAYVYQHSARAMAPLYWFPSFWAGQEGSFLLWAFWTSVLGVVLTRTAGSAERRVVPIYSTVLLFLVSMLLLRSPFVPLDTQGLPTPTEGLGLNPNLENPWMVIHPPTLFLGFASLAVPFAFAVSALLWRDWDGWLRRALPWGLFGFAVLGLAMMMGGYWAYEMLGWGGFWEWDPVENGPFIPWMGLVAFLHAAQISRVRGGFGRPTLFFGMLPFAGVLYESYMTRSGVLTDFSVHSFSALGGIGNGLLLGALGGASALSIGLLAWRAREIGKREDGAASVWDVPNTREYGYALAVTLLTLCAVIAAVGMSAPLLTGLGVKLHLAKYTASVTEDYHNRVMFPMAVLLAIGMGIGPHLAWRERGGADSRRLLIAYAVSVAAALVFVGLARWAGGTGLTGVKLAPQVVLWTACVFAVVSNGMLLWKKVGPPVPPSLRGGSSIASAVLRSGPASEGEPEPLYGVSAPQTWGGGGVSARVWTVGGTLAHLGAALLLLGIVCLVVFTHKQTDVLLVKNLPVSVLNGTYKMTYKGQTSDFQTDRNNALLFDVASRDGRERFTARLPFALRAMEGGDKKLIGHPAIVHHAGGDLYLALKDGPDQFYPRGRFVEKIGLGRTGKFGPYAIEFVRFERDPHAAALAMAGQMPEKFPVWADLRVTYKGKTTPLRPQFVMRRDSPGQPDAPEIALPGGWLLAFQNMNAGSADKNNPDAGAMNEAGSFVLRPNGPVLEGFQLDVTTRPMVNLIWVGTLLIFAGGLVSMRRRILENRAEPVPDMSDLLPQGEGGAQRREGSRRRAKPAARKAVAKPAPSLATESLAAGQKGK